MTVEELDRRGADLLDELRRNPASDGSREFDALFYEIVWRYLRMKHSTLGERVGRYLGIQGGLAPVILPEEIDEVAHEATTLALFRVRKGAARFDRTQGTATGWIFGAAEYAYVEVAKTIVKARRSEDLVFVEQENLLGEPDPGPTPEEYVTRHIEDTELLEEAASHLTASEFAAIRLVITLGYSYEEAAATLFGDGTLTRKVDGLLTRGKRKLKEAWGDRGVAHGDTESSNVPPPRDR